mmetsp:Transcript_126734/g.282501  ORF Transcript_126734/g.282501 Transcript_126734/m.282501 type:complete len:109 (+) Transcript_126734:250-576(+)
MPTPALAGPNPNGAGAPGAANCCGCIAGGPGIMPIGAYTEGPAAAGRGAGAAAGRIEFAVTTAPPPEKPAVKLPGPAPNVAAAGEEEAEVEAAKGSKLTPKPLAPLCC